MDRGKFNMRYSYEIALKDTPIYSENDKEVSKILIKSIELGLLSKDPTMNKLALEILKCFIF